MNRRLYEALFESFMEDMTSRIAEKVAERLRVTEPPHTVQSRPPRAIEEQPDGSATPETSKAPAIGSEYLSTAQAAELLSLTVKGLEGMRAKGTGPKFLRVGGRIRYRRSDLTS
jgi:hypothetical protein